MIRASGGTRFSCIGAISVLAALSGCYDGYPGRGAAPPIADGDLAPAPEGTGALPGDTGEAESSDDGDVSTDTGGAAQAESSGDSTTGDANDPQTYRVGASGIEPREVVVNQGVAVALTADGSVIPQRSAPVVHSRPTRITVGWTLQPNWQPRLIWAELHLLYADDTETVLKSQTLIDGPSGPHQSDDNFNWLLHPDEIPRGTKWWVSFHENEPTPDGEIDIFAPSLPASGTAALDDAGPEQRLRVVLVPYRHQLDGCDQVPPIDDAFLTLATESLEMRFPVQEVELTLHDEAVFTGATVDLGELLVDAADLRAADDPDPDVYYYGLIRSCDDTNAGGLGYRLLDPTAVTSAPSRASVGRYYDSGAASSIETMIHEIGHNHGRMHVACAGDKGETDVNYPIAGGVTGVWGWGIHDLSFRSPDHTDFMSYCDNEWVSSYGWTVAADVIDGLHANVAAAGPAGERPTLDAVALLVRGGTVVHARHIPGLGTAPPTDVAQWHGARGNEAATWHEVPIDHGSQRMLVVPVPNQGLAGVRSLTLTVDGRPLHVPAIAIAAGRPRTP